MATGAKIAPSAATAVGTRPKRRLRGFSQEERVAYLFLSPWLIGLFVLIVIPLVWAVYISMTNEELVRYGEFIGLDNYARALQDEWFWKSVGVTIRWLVLATPLFLVAGLALSLLLNQRLPLMNLIRTILYVPAVLSGVAVAVLWFTLLNPDGALNQILKSLGVAEPPNWFQEPTWAMPALAIMTLWTVGGGAVIFLAGLQNIPPHLYEAAAIDGAGPVAKFRHVTLPMLSPTIFFIVINLVVDALLIFGPAFVISQGSRHAGPDDSLLFFLYLIWRTAFRDGEIGYGVALAWFLTLLGLLIVWVTLRFEKRFVFYEAGGEP
jgi:ABC-type sugar transport system permease subunit